MNHTYKALSTDLDFLTVALNQIRVYVWHVLGEHEYIIDYGGSVEAYSTVSIKIMGKKYFRNTFEFRVQK